MKQQLNEDIFQMKVEVKSRPRLMSAKHHLRPPMIKQSSLLLTSHHSVSEIKQPQKPTKNFPVHQIITPKVLHFPQRINPTIYRTHRNFSTVLKRPPLKTSQSYESSWG